MINIIVIINNIMDFIYNNIDNTDVIFVNFFRLCFIVEAWSASINSDIVRGSVSSG